MKRTRTSEKHSFATSWRLSELVSSPAEGCVLSFVASPAARRSLLFVPSVLCHGVFKMSVSASVHKRLADDRDVTYRASRISALETSGRRGPIFF